MSDQHAPTALERTGWKVVIILSKIILIIHENHNNHADHIYNYQCMERERKREAEPPVQPQHQLSATLNIPRWS